MGSNKPWEIEAIMKGRRRIIECYLLVICTLMRTLWVFFVFGIYVYGCGLLLDRRFGIINVMVL